MSAARSLLPATATAAVPIVRLTRLAGAITPWPVRPSALVERLRDRDGAAAFARLVRIHYPEQAEAILSTQPTGQESTVAARLRAFGERFSRDVFPLEPVWQHQAGFAAFVAHIPIQRMTIDGDDLHDLASRPPGERLLFAAIAPFVADRVGPGLLRASVQELVPVAVWREVPRRPPADTDAWRFRLRGGRYQAVVSFLHWVSGSTNNPFLDPPERYAGGWSWHADSIRHFREAYRRALTLRQHVDDFAAWLEHDPARRFARTIQALYGKDHSDDPDDTDDADQRPVHQSHPGQRSLPLGLAQG
jgi:hypothetical protein